MKIDGKEIAQDIFDDLRKRVRELKEKNITPHLVIILIGENPASVSYVRQKELKAQQIGAQSTVYRLQQDTPEEKILSTIENLNNDNTVHGIIVQRPLPEHVNSESINNAVTAKKDIDAFHPNSPYQMPLALAVVEILKNILPENFQSWIKNHQVVVVGKGETGGGPTIEMLKKLGAAPKVVDSKTQNPDELLKQADLIISTVGKANIVSPSNIKQGVILIGVGMHRGEDGKLHADYNEEEIKNIALHYTPVPGGVGPVNVAMLLKNLILAAGIDR